MWDHCEVGLNRNTCCLTHKIRVDFVGGFATISKKYNALKIYYCLKPDVSTVILKSLRTELRFFNEKKNPLKNLFFFEIYFLTVKEELRSFLADS